MKIAPRFMAIIVLLIVFGGIIVSAAFDQWVTTTTKEPVKFKDGEFAGQYNPADIRGSYTFGDVSRLFNIPIEDLAGAYHLPESDPAAVALKTLEDRFIEYDVDLGTSSIRLFTALYTGLPFDLTTQDSYLLPEGAEVLKEKANLTPEQLEYVNSHVAGVALTVEPTIQPTSDPATGVNAASTLVATKSAVTRTLQGPGTGSGTPDPEHTPTDRLVSGRTTFKNLLDWGVKPEDFLTTTSYEMPSANILVKDWATAKGLSFPTLKTQLQILVDAAK